MRLVPFSSRVRRSFEDPGVFGGGREIERMFDRLMRSPLMGDNDLVPSMGGPWMPSVDISETENEIVLRAEVPGINPEQIDITVSGDRLIISGEKSEEHEEKEEHYYHCERRFGAFERSIELPSTADVEKISADHTNGVLTVHVPKHEAAKPKRVQIESRSDGSKRKQVAVSERDSGSEKSNR